MKITGAGMMEIEVGGQRMEIKLRPDGPACLLLSSLMQEEANVLTLAEENELDDEECLSTLGWLEEFGLAEDLSEGFWSITWAGKALVKSLFID